jgi:hypothetical protein
MTQHRRNTDVLGFCLEESHRGVLRQKQLIARLRMKGQSTEQAETGLKRFEKTLFQLESHWVVMLETNSLLSESDAERPWRF